MLRRFLAGVVPAVLIAIGLSVAGAGPAAAGPVFGQLVTPPGWSATWSQNGATVTATPLDWNRSIAPNTSVGIGFNGTFTSTNPAPAGFTLNGNPCDPA